LDQWYREFLTYFAPSKIPVYRHYGNHREMDIFLEVLTKRPSTILTSYMNVPELLKRDRAKILPGCLLVCDEVHNIGSAGNVKALKGKLDFEWRLGLSATAEREYDQDGNKFIDEDIGPVVFNFELPDAIRDGILCEFDYVPLYYEFDAEDRERLREIYAMFSARKNSGDPMTKEELYQELARVRKLSKNKLPVFARYVRDHPGILGRCLIFVETMEYGQLIQDIILPFNTDYHTYYGGDDAENLERFSKGGLGCLITCKRISEGVDIRSVSTIILFACARARLETIQRIGRALRTNPEDPGKRATIVDFVREGDFREEVQDEDFEPVDAERFRWLSNVAGVRRESEG